MLSPASPVKVVAAPTGAFLSIQIDIPAVPVGGLVVAVGAVSVTFGAVAPPVHALLHHPGPRISSATFVAVAGDDIVSVLRVVFIAVIFAPVAIPSPLSGSPTARLVVGNCCRLAIVDRPLVTSPKNAPAGWAQYLPSLEAQSLLMVQDVDDSQ